MLRVINPSAHVIVNDYRLHYIKTICQSLVKCADKSRFSLLWIWALMTTVAP
jgi:hypothetical protein